MFDNKIAKILNDQRKSGNLCDVIIKLNSEFQLWAHFCVIAAQSSFVGNKYFLQEAVQFSIHNPLKIEICNFDCKECLCDMLDFLYSNDIVVSPEHQDHLKSLSKILHVQELQRLLFDNIDEKELNIDENYFNFDQPQPQINIETKFSKKYIQSINDKTAHKSAQSKMHYCLGCKYRCYKPAEMLAHLIICDIPCSKCSLCDSQFDTVSDLQLHLSRHDNVKPFFCENCDLRFTTKTAMNLHTPKHSTETPFICPHCGKGFKWKQGLNSHLLVHSKEKKLLCDECGYSTAHLKTLKAHKLGHTGNLWRCSVPGCSYSSRRKENLKIHIATHKNETPFVCEICGHRFSQSKNLKRHALIHISKDLHKCPHCSFSSHRTDKLREHVDRQHTEKPLQLELPENPQTCFDSKDEITTISRLKNKIRSKKRLNAKKAKKTAILLKNGTKSKTTNLRPIKPKAGTVFVDLNLLKGNEIVKNIVNK